jgi:hypothetical protein
MIRVAPALAAGAIVLLGAAGAHAQTTLTSNRPGIGDSEALIDRGAIQIESGVQFQDAPPENDRSWTQTWGQLAVRAGVRRWLEVFAGWDGLSLDRVQVDGTSQIESGGNDLRVGAKLALLDEDAHGLTLTVAPAWSFPVGADEFSSNSTDGSLRLLWARSLPRDWSISGNVVSTYTSDEAGRYLDNGVMAGLTRSITPALSVFGEVATAVLAQRADSWTVDAGLAWTPRPNLQWDLSVGRGLHDADERWFVSAGISVRRP